MFSNQMARRFMRREATPKMQNQSTAYGQGKMRVYSVHDHVLDGTSPKDACSESALERGPSNAPVAVEDGPTVHP